MRKATLVKLLCLVVFCALLMPLVMACGDDTPPAASSSTNDATNNDNGNNDGGKTETVTVNFRGNGKGAEINGEASVQVTKGGKLSATQVPEALRDGFVLDGWAYDQKGDNMWTSADIFKEDTPLYAIWSVDDGTDNSGNEGDDSGNSGATNEKVTVNFRGNGKGTEFEGNTTIEVAKGGKLSATQVPSAYRDGYTFEYWAYDSNGDNEWQSGDVFKEDTILYAIWAVDTNNGGNNGGTDSSNNGGNNDSTDSSNNGGNTGDNGGQTPPPASNKVTIEFNTGVGYFEDASLYEVEIDKGGRLSTLPTPVHESAAMLFVGWYKDANFSVAASRSDKYEADTVLYAYWTEQVTCTDGSYDHVYTAWDTDTQPTCTKAGTVAQYCQYCNAKQSKPGDPAKGHQFGAWQEAFMARERTCARLGCGEKEIQSFKDVTLEVLGSAPAEQIEGNTDAFFQVPFTALINGTWNESYGKFVGPNGSATAYVIFTLVEPTTLDRIYFKGDGTVNMNIYVQYEGEDDYTFIGLCAGVSDKENTPFKEPDPTKKIAKIKFQEENPKRGESLWQEVAFVKVATEEE